jgi:hypothetical protein
VTPTGEVLGSGLRFPSMVAALIKSADLLKAQAHWPPFDLTQGGEQVETATGEACSLDVIS